MITLSEQQMISQLEARLTAEYTSVPSEEISRLVEDTYARFTTSRVRDFVPLFVERNVRAQLSTLRR